MRCESGGLAILLCEMYLKIIQSKVGLAGAGYNETSSAKMNASVMLLGLASPAPRMYLVCRFEGYDDERYLALHGMIWSNDLTPTFNRPKDFDLK